MRNYNIKSFDAIVPKVVSEHLHGTISEFSEQLNEIAHRN